MSLANDYRPADWNDLTEQNITATILQNMCDSDFISNRNILLTGPSGCGKTTIARLIANKLNNGVGDIIEVDAASHSGVDAMRDITEQAKQFPIVGNYKFIILDECHAISSGGWQCLLKVLENAPAKTFMIFCTTNPEKIPETITSRVQQFQLSKISLEGIENRITYVLDSEISKGRDIKYDTEGVKFIAKLANGGMRDALTLLDKVLLYTTDINSVSVSKALNMSNYDDYFNLLTAVGKRDNASIAEIIDRVYNSGANFVKWFENFSSFVMNIVKYILLKDINRTIIPAHYDDKLSKYNTNHYNLCLQLSGTLSKALQELKSSNYQQELMLSYLCVKQKVGE